jgi:hypothetical protein
VLVLKTLTAGRNESVFALYILPFRNVCALALLQTFRNKMKQ